MKNPLGLERAVKKTSSFPRGPLDRGGRKIDLEDRNTRAQDEERNVGGAGGHGERVRREEKREQTQLASRELRAVLLSGAPHADAAKLLDESVAASVTDCVETPITHPVASRRPSREGILYLRATEVPSREGCPEGGVC